MEREIKFRGLRVDGKGWVYGSLLNKQSIGEVGENLSHYSYSTVIPETVGQFTGLTDRNGQEIYEGDKLEPEEEEIENIVKWDEFEATYVVYVYGYNYTIGEGGQEVYDNEPTIFDSYNFRDVLLENIKVIGNIHEK